MVTSPTKSTSSPSSEIQPLAASIKRFQRSKIRALVVTDAAKMVGILTVRDVLAQIDRRGAAAIEESVREAMTADVTSVAPESSLEEAHRVFMSKNVSHLPVVENGKLVGLVTPADVLARHVTDLDRQRELLQAYITNAVL